MLAAGRRSTRRAPVGPRASPSRRRSRARRARDTARAPGGPRAGARAGGAGPSSRRRSGAPRARRRGSARRHRPRGSPAARGRSCGGSPRAARVSRRRARSCRSRANSLSSLPSIAETRLAPLKLPISRYHSPGSTSEATRFRRARLFAQASPSSRSRICAKRGSRGQLGAREVVEERRQLPQEALGVHRPDPVSSRHGRVPDTNPSAHEHKDCRFRLGKRAPATGHVRVPDPGTRLV